MKDLVSEIKKYLVVFLHLKKLELMSVMAYPVPFFVSVFAVILVMGLSILFFKVNFSFIDNISGWNYYQILAVLASYMILEGLMWFFFAMLNPINHFIRQGFMDSIILKPIDSQFLASFWKGDLEDIMRVFVGIFLLKISIVNTLGFNMMHLVLYLVMLFNGVVIFYSLALVMRTVSFWVIDGSGVWLLIERISGSSQYPTDIYYNKIVRGTFTFIIPLAFMTTVPAKILTNNIIDWKLVGLSFGMCLVFFIGSRWFWKFSLNHYASASS
ncbi:MAG: hypothetical protein ACD_5C00080G0001 [uncultured bacterium]|nr:MAG: hypothetical protein ACD_5C00080G0001 [uncultured bacterium]